MSAVAYRCPITPEKAKYLSHEEANDRARGIRRKTGVLFRAYECPGCGAFHLTTKQRRR